MTRDALWLGFDIVVLRGAAVRRMHAAMELEARRLTRNGRALPADVQWDLAVLRAASEAARSSAEPVLVPQGVPQAAPASLSTHEDLIDIVEIARRLAVSDRYARRLCRNGRFASACRAGREWRVSAAEVEAYDAARREKRSA